MAPLSMSTLKVCWGWSARSANPSRQATESPSTATRTGGPEVIVPLASEGPATSAALGSVAATVTATTPKKAPEVTSQLRHSASVAIRPKRIGRSTR